MTKKTEEQSRCTIRMATLYEEIDHLREEGYKMGILEALMFHVRGPFRFVSWLYRTRRDRFRCWHCKKKIPGYRYVGNTEFYPYCTLECVKTAEKLFFGISVYCPECKLVFTRDIRATSKLCGECEK